MIALERRLRPAQPLAVTILLSSQLCGWWDLNPTLDPNET